MSRERVCATSDVPVGEVRTVTCDGRRLAISNIDGTLHAIDDICTHDGGPLGDGVLRDTKVICPRHGAAFDARTGRVLSLPAVRNVGSYEVTVDGDDVYVECGDAGS